MTLQHFVTNPSEYASLRDDLLKVFYPDRRLPDQVFLSEFERFYFLEFDLMLTEGFWHILSGFVAACGDSEVVFTAHDPNPESYYFANFHRYGIILLNRTASALDYYMALREEPKGSSADALLYVTNVASWVGDSRVWAFWGERDLGIGVLAVRNPHLSCPKVEGIRCFDVEEAISDLVALNLRNERVLREFSNRLRQTYGDSVPVSES